MSYLPFFKGTLVSLGISFENSALSWKGGLDLSRRPDVISIRVSVALLLGIFFEGLGFRA